MQKKSPLFRLNSRDLIQGLIIILISALLSSFYIAFDQSGFDLSIGQLKEVAKVTILAGLSYLIKNLVQGQRRRKTKQYER